MHRTRVVVTLTVLASAAASVGAQPVDPYAQDRARAPRAQTPPAAAPAAPTAAPPAAAPASPPAAPGDRASTAPEDPYGAPASDLAPAADPVLAERVALALVGRAQELFDAKGYLDAKQLAVEALVANPRGATAERARAIIHAVNVQLGIPEDSPKPPPPEPAPEPVDLTPIQDPTLSAPAVAPPAEGRPTTGRLAGRVHGALYGGLLGATVGSFLSSDRPAAGAVPGGLAIGAAGALAAPMLVDRLHLTEGEVRTIGAATTWGGVIGGLLGDVGKLHGTTSREVLVGASVGATLAGVGGYALQRSRKLTRGDVALIDTLAGIGAVGGLTVGMVMQPAETEAYSLNSVFGIAGGVLVGLVAAPQTNTTPRRMLRVAGLAAAGGAAPFLLYAAIRSSTSTADERITGILASGGLVVGAYLGLRFTRGMDEGLDTLDGKAREADDAPIALVGRSSSGRWGVGGLGLAPLSPALSPERGMALQLVGASF